MIVLFSWLKHLDELKSKSLSVPSPIYEITRSTLINDNI